MCNFNIVKLNKKYFYFFQAGANMIVSGTAVIQAENPPQVIKLLKESVNKWINFKTIS